MTERRPMTPHQIAIAYVEDAVRLIPDPEGRHPCLCEAGVNGQPFPFLGDLAEKYGLTGLDDVKTKVPPVELFAALTDAINAFIGDPFAQELFDSVSQAIILSIKDPARNNPDMGDDKPPEGSLRTEIRIKPSCFLPMLEMTVYVPKDRDAEEYIDELLEAMLKEDLTFNVEWDFI